MSVTWTRYDGKRSDLNDGDPCPECGEPLTMCSDEGGSGPDAWQITWLACWDGCGWEDEEDD